LKEEKNKRTYDDLLHAAGVMIINLDREFKISDVSYTVEKFTGRKKNKLVGKGFAETFAVERDVPKTTQKLRHSLSQQTPCTFEIRCRNNPDQQRYLLCTTLPSSDPEYPGTSDITCYDITRYRELEKQLLHADKLISLGEMTAGIAHELKNFLTMVGAQVQMLSRVAAKHEDDELTRNIEKIITNIDRTFRMVINLVDFSRPAIDKSRRSSLNDLFEVVLNLCEFQIRKRQVKVEKDFSRDISAVICRQSQIEQVLLNLILNSLQAMQQGEGVLKLTTRPYDDNYVLWSIKDNGVGVPPENQELVFEPFFTTKEAAEGTGLGLAIVKRILDEHNAQLKLVSKPGEGTEIEVLMPINPSG
jgi:two-component system, NtrC family, sensor kinase